MTKITMFVGLDVHKMTIAVATVEGRASADVRFHSTIANTPEAIRSLLRKLSKDGHRLHHFVKACPFNSKLFQTRRSASCRASPIASRTAAIGRWSSTSCRR